MKLLDHCDAKRKKMGALDSCFGPDQQSIPQFSLRHREFIKATRSAALVVLNSSPQGFATGMCC